MRAAYVGACEMGLPPVACFCLLALLSCGGAVAAAPAALPEAGEAAVATPVEAAAAEFRRLRKIKGHFDGAGWVADVDRWDGSKHRAMQQLAAALGTGTSSTATLQRLLGTPDRKVAAVRYAFASSLRPPLANRRGMLWVYHWRGEHDALLFTVNKQRVVSAHWFYAGE